MAWVFVASGLVTLLLAGDFLVRGAVNLALRLGISALLVSLTVVAFGTSAPELLIVLSAMADGASGLAMGNVIGSNTANILLVLGLPALIFGLHTADFPLEIIFAYDFGHGFVHRTCVFGAIYMVARGHFIGGFTGHFMGPRA